MTCREGKIRTERKTFPDLAHYQNEKYTMPDRL
jgi:hypothetical protein